MPVDSSSNHHLIQHLSNKPVLGVDMSSVSVLRLDQFNALAPGNKFFKLNALTRHINDVDAVLSFGGAWSNHLHALAARGHEQGFTTVGIVRGERPGRLSAMLHDAQDWGMKLHFVSREDYRRRHDQPWQRQIAKPYGRCLVIPEGGASLDGVSGCREIAKLLAGHVQAGDKIMLAVGTGATIAGMLAGLNVPAHVEGVSVLKGVASQTSQSVVSWLAELGQTECAPWTIRDDGHEGGYARVTPSLKAFILAFEAVHGIPLDPVYTGKLFYRIHRDLMEGNTAERKRIIAIHTGGLQGRRGFSWLNESPVSSGIPRC